MGAGEAVRQQAAVHQPIHPVFSYSLYHLITTADLGCCHKVRHGKFKSQRVYMDHKVVEIETSSQIQPQATVLLRIMDVPYKLPSHLSYSP